MINLRPYQQKLIDHTRKALLTGVRRVLLVSPTGSGKTIMFCWLCAATAAKGNRVVVLLHRQELVKQVSAALTAMEVAHGVIARGAPPTDHRVQVAMIGTLARRLDRTQAFDLIVIDEAHRSVYQKYGAIFDWFDGLLVGLTATPKDEVDHNTYRLFQLEDGVPTDAYSLDEAVADGYLVPPKGVSVGTKFLRQGIRYVDLTEEERDRWDELDWGEDGAPTEVGAEEINRFLFNEDTVDKVLEVLFTEGRRVGGGDRLGKTIIFAKNQAHAEFIKQRFDAQYPGYGGNADFRAQAAASRSRGAHTINAATSRATTGGINPEERFCRRSQASAVSRSMP